MSQVRMYVMGTLGLEIQRYGIAIMDGYQSFYVPISEEKIGHACINSGMNVLKEVIGQVIYQEENLEEEESEAMRLFNVLENIKDSQSLMIDDVTYPWDDIKHLFDIPLFNASPAEDEEGEVEKCPDCDVKLISMGNHEECPNCGKFF